MLKKVVAVILILTLLAGCENSSPPVVSSSESNLSSSTAAPPIPVAEPEPEPDPNYMPQNTASLTGTPLSLMGEKSLPNKTGYEYIEKWYQAIDENIYFVDRLELEITEPDHSGSTLSRIVQYNITNEEYKIVYQTDTLVLKSGCMLENGNLIYTGNWAENSSYVDYGIYIYDAQTGKEDCVINVSLVDAEVRNAVLDYKNQKLFYSVFYFENNAAELYEYDLVKGESEQIADNVQGFDISESSAFYISDYELYRVDDNGSILMGILADAPGIASLSCYGQYVLVQHENKGITLIDTEKDTSTYKSFCQEPGLLPCADENGFMLFGGSPVDAYNRLYIRCYLLDYNGNMRMADKKFAPVLHITDDLIFYHEYFNGAEIHSMDKAEFLAGLTPA